MYQARISGLAGYVAFVGGFMAIYPVFAQYKPPTRCATAFDTTQYNLTWDEIFTLSTNTPSCQGYDQDDSSECNYCNYTDTALQDCDDKTYEGFLKGVWI